MKLNLEPVKVDISIETTSLVREAFYNLCFITENDEAPRTIEVRTLSELLGNGFTRQDLAYNFCVGVFLQKGIESVFIRSKRSYETYEEAFDADDNHNYYYLIIESKDLEVISNFNDYVNSVDDYKLQFYSSDQDTIQGKKLVHYYQELKEPEIPALPEFDFSELPINGGVTINNSLDYYNNIEAKFSVEVNGVLYNEDMSIDIDKVGLSSSGLGVYQDSSGNISFYCTNIDVLDVKLVPSQSQKLYSNTFISGDGVILANGTFLFRLASV